MDANPYNFIKDEIYLIEPNTCKIINDFEWKAIIDEIKKKEDINNKKKDDNSKNKKKKKRLLKLENQVLMIINKLFNFNNIK